ncbi:MAG: RDD family protein [Vulcanimicrobiota bacterium]
MQTITIRTPEQIELSYDLAGAGSRFYAVVIDTILQSSAFICIWLTLLLTESLLHVKISKGLTTFAESSISISTLILGALGGFIIIGYYLFFETMWNGQTPGKKAAGLKVIKDNGSSITIFDAAVRNFMRTVDFLPSGYVLGAIVMLMHSRRKRIGDWAAGTMVIKVPIELPPILLTEMEAEPPASPLDLSLLTTEEYHLVRNYIIRRTDLSGATRAELSEKLVSLVMKRLSLEQDPFGNGEELLEWIAVSREKVER